jgi:triacylglycerol esterase/lipase EstA (alpha/beta hydrolase family)
MKKIVLLFIGMICIGVQAQIDTSIIKKIVKIEEYPSTIFSPGDISPIIVPQQEDSSFRRIYFIHGLGGDASSWQQASDACWDQSLNIVNFYARNVEVSRPEYVYSTNTTLNSAAYDVRQQIRNQSFIDYSQFGMNPNQAFMIGHSQGGLIIRSLVHMDLQSGANIPAIGKGYGGFVTIASPLQGAQIINNRSLIEQMAHDACNCLLKGPEVSNLAVRGILKLLGQQQITDNVCDLIGYNILPVFFSQYYNNITNDYKVGAGAIQQYNSDIQNSTYLSMPKIAIYGVEPRENILWRTGNWLIKNPNSEPPFEANDDWEFYYNTIYPTYMSYVSKVHDYQTRIQVLSASQFFLFPFVTPEMNLLSLMLIRNYRNKMIAWQTGVNWFNRANANWESIIGARQYQVNTVNAYYCKHCSIGPNWILSPSLQVCLICNCREIITIPTQTITYTIAENDGIVLAESAKNLPGATHCPSRILMNNVQGYDGSSHMQIRNDKYLKGSLNKLFDGDYGTFFKLKRKI